MVTPEQIATQIATSRSSATASPTAEKMARKLFQSERYAHVWEDMKSVFDQIKFLSVGCSQNGNRHEVRIQMNGRHVLRIASFSIERGYEGADIMDELFSRLLRDRIDHINFYEEVKAECSRQGLYIHHSTTGSGYLASLWLGEPRISSKICMMSGELRKFYSSGISVARNNKHERDKAINQMRPFVKSFLKYGGSYDAMVDLLQNEIVHSIQES